MFGGYMLSRLDLWTGYEQSWATGMGLYDIVTK
jgi:hypothetical protein